jgi:hypothetical protein
VQCEAGEALGAREVTSGPTWQGRAHAIRLDAVLECRRLIIHFEKMEDVLKTVCIILDLGVTSVSLQLPFKPDH